MTEERRLLTLANDCAENIHQFLRFLDKEIAFAADFLGGFQ